MPLITESFDSLPYIDAEPTPQTRAQITALLSSQLPPSASTTLHPSIPELPEPAFSPAFAAELERAAASQPLVAIDTSRYESLDAPEDSDDPSPESIRQWKDTLRKSYTAHAHLSQRQNNLAILDQNGRNTWLLGNHQLEQELKSTEKSLVEAREDVENVNRQRKGAQEGVRAEIEGLDATWRTGVGRVLEVEVANEQLRRDILEARRRLAAS